MPRRSLSVFALLSLLVCSAAYAQADATLLFAELRGTNEVPPNTSTAVGSALITIDNNNNLTWEVNIGGLQNPTLSHIHQNVAGQNGNVVIGFASNASQFVNGRTQGSITNPTGTTLATIQAIKANPAGFYVNVHSTAFGGGEIRGQLAPATEQDIAVAGNVTTGAGDKFVTDTRVFNPSSTATVVAMIEFFASGSAPNVNSAASKTLVIPPRGEAVLNDVTGASNLNVPGSVGALRVTSNTGVVVSSDIFNDQRGASPSRGTFGQFVPAVARANALTRGVIIHLSNKNRDVSNPSGFRTNIGFFNPNQEAATIGLTLRDSTGASLGTASIVVQALQQVQTPITTLFPGVDLGNSAPLTLAINSTMPVLGYGAVNDNASGDSFLVPAQADSGATP